MYHQIRCKPGPVKWQPENPKNNEEQLPKTDKQSSVKSHSENPTNNHDSHLLTDCQADKQLPVKSKSNTYLPGDCQTEEQLSKTGIQLPVLSHSNKQLSDYSQSNEHLSGDNQSNLQLSDNSQNSLQLSVPVPSPEDDSEPEIVFISCPLKLKSGNICGKQFSKPGL